MAFEGFGKNTGPIGPPKAQTSFGNFPRTPSSETLPKLGNGQKYIYHDYDAQIAHSATVRGSHVQDLTTLPFSSDAQILTMRGSRSDLIFSDQGPFVSQQNQSSPLFRNKSPLVPKSTRSPPLAFQNNLHIDGKIPPLAGAQRPSLPPHMRGNSAQSLQRFPFRLPHQRLPTIPTNYDPGRQIPVKHTDQVSKRTRSPPHSPPNVASFEKSALGLRESKRYDKKNPDCQFCVSFV